MTTLNRLATLNITVEISELPLSCICEDDIKAMGREERRALRIKASDIMDAYHFADTVSDEEYKAADSVYWLINAVEDEEYREEHMAEFKAYEAKMNEPDFDWDFYSDWHKDMFGYRPHFRAIPVDEEERAHMCDTWHKARGL